MILFVDSPMSVTTAMERLDLMLKMYQLQTTVIGMKRVFSATYVGNLCGQMENSPSTRIRSFATTAISPTSRRLARDVDTRLSQGAHASNTMERTGMRSASNAPFVRRPLGPAVSCQKMVNFTAPTVIRICMPSAVRSAASRCPKVAFFTTNKRGTKSVSVVTVAMSL